MSVASICININPPYGIKNLEICRANMAWCSDISYVKLPQGHVYVVAIVDIYSHIILDYEVSNTLDTDFCIRCLERCLIK
jgi:putative transposase